MGFSPEELMRRLQRLPRARRYVVAFSGGLDSGVLVHALRDPRVRLGLPLLAVHVDHGLSPDSGDWAAHCTSFCAVRDIELKRVRLELRCDQGESLEACARKARYAALVERMSPGDAVLTAHHRDDQAETFLLQALRGSGVAGLASMPPARRLGNGWLLRPLLDFDRADLERFAWREGLSWVEDHTNEEVRFDRNYLRQKVLPLLRRRWPACAAALARSAAHCGEAAGLVKEQADADLRRLADGDILAVAPLATLPPGRQRAVLRRWLSKRGLPLPDSRRLYELRRQVTTASQDRQPLCTWAGVEVRCWRGGLYAGPAMHPLSGGTRLSWDGNDVLELPGELGTLELQGTMPSGGLEVRFREGGETCARGACHRPLKKLLQELSVPPWLRARVPLVYLDGELAAVGDFLSCERWPRSLSLVWRKGVGWPASVACSPLPESRRP
jgi:tRNA(Ile)-lysidine synthase